MEEFAERIEARTPNPASKGLARSAADAFVDGLLQSPRGSRCSALAYGRDPRGHEAHNRTSTFQDVRGMLFIAACSRAIAAGILLAFAFLSHMWPFTN
jgi:hypothetical protein